eukprot:jgi/Ulvmu1/4147/UM019_0126.1
MQSPALYARGRLARPSDERRTITLTSRTSFRSRRELLVAQAEPEAAVSAAPAGSDSEAERDSDKVPEGCSRYTVELSRPLGLVLEEKGKGEIVVGDVPVGGQAAIQGMVQPGDLLISVTGVAYTKESNYQGATVRSGETRVTVNVRSEKFDTVMAAIGSHKAGQLVQLTFQRC